jgi:hypothetical protein
VRCQMQNPGENTHEPAFAIVTYLPSENRVAHCERDLNWFLDDVDDGVHDEPAHIEFLKGRP